MGVSVRWVQKLWARHRCNQGDISRPAPMGRPENDMHGRGEHSAVLSAFHMEYSVAASLHGLILAEKTANTLGMNSIPQCHVSPKDVRETRSAVRHRVRLVQDRTRVINRVHSLLDRHELKMDASSLHTQKADGPDRCCPSGQCT